jgi:hypothetical protein
MAWKLTSWVMGKMVAKQAADSFTTALPKKIVDAKKPLNVVFHLFLFLS